ncbi:MAG: hypothetical protein ACK6DG_11475 [Cyanobacteriota bacterium]
MKRHHRLADLRPGGVAAGGGLLIPGQGAPIKGGWLLRQSDDLLVEALDCRWISSA